MRARRKSKSYAGPTQNAPAPLDNAQLNALIRNAFAWLWVGMGITAAVASALLVQPIYMEFGEIIIIVFAHLVIAAALHWRLPRCTPKQAGAFFVFYSALTGFTMSTVFSALLYPTVSGALVNACLSTTCLFGLMTLIGWRTRLDLDRARSYVLMALLGLLIAFLVNKLLAGARFDYVFSFFSVLFFSALAAYHRKPFASMAADPNLRINPADSLRFSILAALQLYLSASHLFVIALSSSVREPSLYGNNYRHMHHHQRSHYGGMGMGSSGFGGGGGGMGGGGGSMGGGGGSIGGGGGGSFTP